MKIPHGLSEQREDPAGRGRGEGSGFMAEKADSSGTRKQVNAIRPVRGSAQTSLKWILKGGIRFYWLSDDDAIFKRDGAIHRQFCLPARWQRIFFLYGQILKGFRQRTQMSIFYG